MTASRFASASALAIVSMVFAVASIALPLIDDVDAATEYSAEIVLDIDEYVEIYLYDYLDGDSYEYCASDGGSLPTGLSKDGKYVKGTPTELGTWNATFRLSDSYISLWGDGYLYVTFTVAEVPEYHTVSYDAGVGLVNGKNTWSEEILAESYASLPTAVHSTGAYTFLGWSLSETSTNVVASHTVTKDVTLHAVWQRNTVGIDDATATISQDQSSVMTIVTDPSDAVVSISEYGGLGTKNVWIVNHRLHMDMTSVEPGTYYVTLDADFTGYLTGHSVVTIYVPITIVKPIEYTLVEGDVFSYTPVTNPTNASISLVEVSIDGVVSEDNGGLKVNGRTISGTLSEPGTYEITYRASLEGYVDVTNHVMVFVTASSDVPSMGAVSLASISAASRSDEPRVYDFVAIGGQNVTNYVWSIDGEVFASSSATALYEFPASGVYTIECTAYGASGDSVTLDVTVMCSDNRHRDAAWVGVEYSYVVPGNVEISVPEGSFLKIGAESIGGQLYTLMSGTPSAGDVDKGFDVTVGSESWTIKVYPAEGEAPVSKFTLSVKDDGYTVEATFTGSNASFHRFDFDNDGVYEDGNIHRYEKSGRYVISCIAVNNVSEVTSSMRVEIDIAPSESVDLDGLTDFSMNVGERMYIDLDLRDGDSVQTSGSATAFVELDDNTLRVHPTERGIFSLTVQVLHTDGTFDSATIEIRVAGPDDPIMPVPEDIDYLTVVVLFVISVSTVCIVVLYDMHSGRISAWFHQLRSSCRRKRMASHSKHNDSMVRHNDWTYSKSSQVHNGTYAKDSYQNDQRRFR